jgi:hypothetical protein
LEELFAKVQIMFADLTDTGAQLPPADLLLQRNMVTVAVQYRAQTPIFIESDLNTCSKVLRMRCDYIGLFSAYGH